MTRLEHVFYVRTHPCQAGWIRLIVSLGAACILDVTVRDTDEGRGLFGIVLADAVAAHLIPEMVS